MQATQVDAILVPALGFDQNYNRLGYGKGFYDKYLAKHPHIPHIGVGFKEQLVKSLPTESHDISLSALSLF
ncbi:MAG: hypothetical protein S4CHLAM45_10850 [Chlamydiales bacterium]|nr:hypothetical protein [Chlamydiales bacterium]MCH9619577.1 hypothetical protein [Chlamydiales bacterium]MCH9623183.1 hypothetical protein [Chlamydiales bacterium]